MIVDDLIFHIQNLQLTNILKQLIILFVFLYIPSQALAQRQQAKMPLGDFKVRILKRRHQHIHTAALLCVLYENSNPENSIKQAWRDNLETPISANDQFLVISIMREMCPRIKPQKFFLK